MHQDVSVFTPTTFLSTLPARGATQRHRGCRPGARFLSTLPARGATAKAPTHAVLFSNFYPRSPRGERPHLLHILVLQYVFLSTLPARGATAKPNKNTAGFCAKGPNADLGCTKWEGQFCAISMIFLRAGAVRRGFAGANLPVGPCALGLRTGGGRRPDYTSSTSSWDHCGARPMCSTRVL